MNADTIPEQERYDRHSARNSINTTQALSIAQSFLPERLIRSIEELAGGFSNANFKVSTTDCSYILRIYAENSARAERDASLLKFLATQNLNTPRLVEIKQYNSTSSALLLEYIEGMPLSEILMNRSIPHDQTLFYVGATLAQIHSITFEKCGLFGTTGQIRSGCENISDFARTLIQRALDGNAGLRIPAELKLKLCDFIKSQWSTVECSYTSPRLVHCDFNPKNILVFEDRISILDWEFAISGHPLIDFGNFFRFEDDYRDSEKREFLAGYHSAGGWLPDNWQIPAQLLDVVAMCDFLDQRKDYSKTCRTALAVLERIVRNHYQWMHVK